MTSIHYCTINTCFLKQQQQQQQQQVHKEMLRSLSDDYKWLLDTCTVRLAGRWANSTRTVSSARLCQGESIVGGWAIESVELSWCERVPSYSECELISTLLQDRQHSTEVHVLDNYIIHLCVWGWIDGLVWYSQKIHMKQQAGSDIHIYMYNCTSTHLPMYVSRGSWATSSTRDIMYISRYLVNNLLTRTNT